MLFFKSYSISLSLKSQNHLDQKQAICNIHIFANTVNN